MTKAAVGRWTWVLQHVSKQNQDVTFLALVRVGTAMVRIQIRSNHYTDQQSATAAAWDGRAWQEIWTLPAGLMQTSRDLYHQREPVTAADFASDAQQLLDAARLVYQLD